jgi:hypothetical protein
MATFPSMAKAEIDGGVPPFLNAQMSRGATLKKVISYTAEGAATEASSIIQDIDLPEGCIIDLSSIALSHDGVGAGDYTVAVALTDKNGNIVNDIIAPIGVLAATTTANEIVRLGVTANGNKPGLLMVDPYEKILNAIVHGGKMPDVQNKNSVLKERYHFCIVVQNSKEVAGNKTFTIVMDCIIP